MRCRRGLARGTILLLAGLAVPAAAAAQERRCDLVQEADFRRITNIRGESIWYFRDPVRLRCTGGVTLAADSAVYNPVQSALELIGAVAYRDSTRQLTSGWANYLGRTEQLLARDDVVLTDLTDGSVVTGQELQYLRESTTRSRSHVLVRGGRPRAVLREAPAAPPGPAPAIPPPGADTAAPLEIVADRLEFIGDTLFLARGTVELERGATTGASDSARYNQPAERMTLLGRAHVEDERYRLEGERIDAFLQGEALHEVRAEGRTRLVSEELTVDSERLRMGFLDGALDRLEAWNPPPPGAADSVLAGRERALAFADGFRLRADSIDAVADSGRLREVRAVGRGYGERRLDSVTVRLPAAVARDWIQGDTIIGYFAPAPVADTVPGAAADSTEVVLERVVVIGGSGPALSLYRMDPEREGERGAINFMKAMRIILFMTDGEVARVEAEGPLDGVYLDPVGRSGGAPAPARPTVGPGGESP